MTKQIIALLALLSVGLFGAVYAETTTVEVPFDSVMDKPVLLMKLR